MSVNVKNDHAELDSEKGDLPAFHMNKYWLSLPLDQ